MRIISGTMRGTKLFTLEGDNTRPTLDRVKEALFSKINFELEDSIVLDMFSGSGALGLESLSRGANKAVLCDSSRDAIRIINQNIEKTRTKDRIVLLNLDYRKAIEKIKEDNYKFDIVFLDPPYKTDYAAVASKNIAQNNLLNEDGLIVIETDEKDRVINEIDTNLLKIEETKKYGRVYLLFLKSVKN